MANESVLDENAPSFSTQPGMDRASLALRSLSLPDKGTKKGWLAMVDMWLFLA